MLPPTHFRREGEDYGDQILSKAVKAGRRTYFFDVRATRGDDYFLTITESRENHGSRRHVELRPPQDIPLQGGFFEIRRRAERGRRVHPPQQGVPRAGGIAVRSSRNRFGIGCRAGSEAKCAGIPAALPGNGRTSGSGCPGRMRALPGEPFRKERLREAAGAFSYGNLPGTTAGNGKTSGKAVRGECAPCAARHSERNGADCGKSLRGERRQVRKNGRFPKN